MPILLTDSKISKLAEAYNSAPLAYNCVAFVVIRDNCLLRCLQGLPSSGSWQDLKDHMREAGDVCYADVFGNGKGVVEFLHRDDARYAVRCLDDTKFRSHEVRAKPFIYLH